MSEPSAIWSNKLIVFDKEIGLVQNVILAHGRDALKAVVTRIDQLHALLLKMPHVIDVHLDPDIPSIVSDICFQHGVASTVLFNDSKRGKDEEAYLYRLRMERVGYVRRFCRERELSILANRKIRNSLTHIDEHLAKALRRPTTGWFIDAAIAARDQFTAAAHGITVAFCRTYISSEDMIIHLGNEIPLDKLRDEAIFVLAVVFGSAPRQPQTSPGP